MSGVAMAIVVGRLGRDPEYSVTKNGKGMCKFSVATDKGRDSPTQWHNVTCWGRQAEVARDFLRKGSEVYLRCDIEYNEVEKDGVKRTYTNLTAWELCLIGGRQGRQESGNPQYADSGFTGTMPPVADEDVPF